MSIQYNLTKGICKQLLETSPFSTYDLTGEFLHVSDLLRSKYHIAVARYIDVAKPHKPYCGDKYVDGTTVKEVKFTKLIIDWDYPPYDTERCWLLYGERPIDESERAALEKQEKQYQDQVRKRKEDEFERLRRELGK